MTSDSVFDKALQERIEGLGKILRSLRRRDMEAIGESVGRAEPAIVWPHNERFWFSGSGGMALSVSHISNGGLGYTSVTLSGHQGFSYRGRFDCGGNDYYNSYWQSITGQASGGWSCSYSYAWRKSLGFGYQAWCGSGPYGQK